MLFTKNKIKKICKSSYFPFIVLIIAMLIIHVKTRAFNDDAFFITQYNQKGFVQYFQERYNIWTTRLIIEFIMMGILTTSFMIWRILDSLMIGLLAFVLSKMFNYEKSAINNWLIVLFMLMYNWIDMSSAGWVATTLNYNWPLTFGLLSLIAVKKIVENKKIKWYEYIIYVLAGLYASNEEQMCIILIPICIVSIIYLLYFKKKNIKDICFIFIQVMISSGLLIFMLTGPGNKLRKEYEIGACFPNYLMQTFTDKIRLGITATMSKYIATPNLVFGFISFLILILVLKKHKNMLYRWIASIPFLTVMILGFGKDIIVNIFPGFAKLTNMPVNGMSDFVNITVYNFYDLRYYIPLVLSCITLGCILISIYLIWGNSLKSFILIFIVILGFASRIALAFSPTLYVSNYRTFIFFEYSIIIVGICVLENLNSILEKSKMKIILNILILLAFLNYVNLVLTI